jgi:ELWxxDGT repeat protein
MVKDINPGSASSYPGHLTDVNGTLFFTANDGTHGSELWKSDGTATGTVLVADINPGSTGSNPTSLTNVNGRLYFAANDGTHGEELWQSDGTPAGTNMVADIIPGSTGSYPSGLTNVNGTLFFAANDGVHGTELWILPNGPSLAVSGFPASTTAGDSHSFTVTALNADGTTNTGYTGTIHFTSSDPGAVLPADYTFTPQDAGVHNFSATLKTAGTQSITATDIVTATDNGSEGSITVNPAAASTMIVAGFPSPTTAGVAGKFTVSVEDAYNNVVTGYTGTVRFSSSDHKAVLPASYTFTPADAGVHTFQATLKTAGSQSITTTDTTMSSLTGTDSGITVNPAAANQFIIRAPSSVSAGASFNLLLTVKDAYGNVVTGYTGTVHFSSTDSTARLPSNYTFTAADRGVHAFTGLVLRKKGNQKITITDTQNSALTGSVTVDVL